MSNNWHGYEQHPDAHSERPWWRLKDAPFRCWVRTDGHRMGHHSTDTPEETLKWLECADREQPMTVPAPKCLQVWVWSCPPHRWPEDGTEATVIGVLHGNPRWSAGVFFGSSPSTWPPPNAVLAAGTGSPWAPEASPIGKTLTKTQQSTLKGKQ